VEFGEIPHQGAIAKERIEGIMNNPYENFHLYVQYNKAYKQVRDEEVRKERLQKKRELRLIHEENVYEMTDVFSDKDYTTYRGEEVVAVWSDSIAGLDFDVKRWYHGFPPRIRRGYEVIEFNPVIIYLCYKKRSQHRFLLGLYGEYVSLEYRKYENLNELEIEFEE